MLKKVLGLFVMSSLTLPAASSVHDFTMNSIDGKPVALSQYKGKVLVIVNVASKCGFTGQYKNLETLYRTYKDRGLVVLGFPANDFLGQEPGSNEQIAQFCKRTYDVSFPMFAKISVKGSDKHPLYQFLTDKKANPQHGGELSWNFNKFIVDKNGKVVARFGSMTNPESKDMVAAIEKALAQ